MLAQPGRNARPSACQTFEEGHPCCTAFSAPQDPLSLARIRRVSRSRITDKLCIEINKQIGCSDEVLFEFSTENLI
jgi:hypothetical protein